MDDYLFAPERYVTEAFVLRSYQPGDGPLLREAIVSSYDYLRPRMLWAKKDQSEEEAEREVRTFRARYLLAEDFIMGIFSPDEAQLWGGVGFHMRHGPVSHGRAEIGMWIRASEAGRGLGTAVLRSLIDWGFTEWPWSGWCGCATPATAPAHGWQKRAACSRRGASAATFCTTMAPERISCFSRF